MLWDPLNAWPKARPWLWAGLAALVCWSQGADFVQSLEPPPDVVMDFFQEWASARNVFNGLPVYTSQRITIEKYLGEYDRDSVIVEVNAHPPTSILLALPFATLSYRTATLVWNLLSLAALAMSLWLVARQLRIALPLWAIFPACTLLLLCGPLRQQNCQGQLNLILLLLLTGIWVADRTGKPWAAGALLGTATAIKLFPGFLIVYFAIRRQWKTVAVSAASLAIWTLVTIGALGVGTYRAYLYEAMPQVQPFLSWWNNSSLTGLARKVFGPGTGTPWMIWRVVPVWNAPSLARLAALVLSGIVLAILAWATRKARTQSEYDLTFGLTIVAMLLVSPVTWDHYFLLLLLPLAIAWLRLPPSGVARLVLLAIVVAIWAPPRLLARVFVSEVPDGLATPLQALTVLSLQSYALLALFGLVLVEIQSFSRQRAAAQMAV